MIDASRICFWFPLVKFLLSSSNWSFYFKNILFTVLTSYTKTVKRHTENKNTRDLFSLQTPNVHSCCLATLYSYLFHWLDSLRCRFHDQHHKRYITACIGICVKKKKVCSMDVTCEARAHITNTLPTIWSMYAIADGCMCVSVKYMRSVLFNFSVQVQTYTNAHSDQTTECLCWYSSKRCFWFQIKAKRRETRCKSTMNDKEQTRHIVRKNEWASGSYNKNTIHKFIRQMRNKGKRITKTSFR